MNRAFAYALNRKRSNGEKSTVDHRQPSKSFHSKFRFDLKKKIGRLKFPQHLPKHILLLLKRLRSKFELTAPE